MHAPTGPAVLLLGHGAGGGIGAPDLLAATRAAIAAGVHVVLVEQPYRVAGRRAPAPAAQLDAAWLAVVSHVRAELGAAPLLFGGRSSGARVACRTAAAGGAAGVLCLAFPVHPPGGRTRTGSPSYVHRRCRCWSCRGSVIRSGVRLRVRAERWCCCAAITRSGPTCRV